VAILGLIGWIFVVVGAIVLLLGVLGVLPAGGGRGFPAWSGGVTLLILGVVLLVVSYAVSGAVL